MPYHYLSILQIQMVFHPISGNLYKGIQCTDSESLQSISNFGMRFTLLSVQVTNSIEWGIPMA